MRDVEAQTGGGQSHCVSVDFRLSVRQGSEAYFRRGPRKTSAQQNAQAGASQNKFASVFIKVKTEGALLFVGRKQISQRREFFWRCIQRSKPHVRFAVSKLGQGCRFGVMAPLMNFYPLVRTHRLQDSGAPQTSQELRRHFVARFLHTNFSPLTLPE